MTPVLSRFLAVLAVTALCACGSSVSKPPSSGPALPPGVTADPNDTSGQPPIEPPASSVNPNIAGAVRLVGRFDTSNAEGPRFSWPNSAIVATFNGSFLKVKLASFAPGTTSRMADYYDVWVDEQEPQELTLDPNTDDYTTCEGLAAGTHKVRIVKRTESRFSTGQLLGVETDTPDGLLPSTASDRRIEFIGDSITAGYGTEASNPNDAICNVNRGEDADLTYAALTAQALGADFTNISWTGIGVISPVNGNDTSASIYERTLAADPNSKWGFNWVPQVVVMNLGTNDTPYASANPTSFSTAYADLLAKVRGHYPQAVIFCLLGPMLQAQDLSNVRTGINAAISARTNAGDGNITLVELTPDDGSRGYACAQHPVAATHALMAAQVEQAIKAKLNW